jgi:hypothetical protein
MNTYFNRPVEYTVKVTLKINNGSFGIKYKPQGEFIFCAQSRSDAVAIAGHHVKGATRSIDTTRIVEIVGSVSVSREVFPLVHPQLRSLSEYASELEAELELVR